MSSVNQTHNDTNWARETVTMIKMLAFPSSKLHWRNVFGDWKNSLLIVACHKHDKKFFFKYYPNLHMCIQKYFKSYSHLLIYTKTSNNWCFDKVEEFVEFSFMIVSPNPFYKEDS